MSEVIEAVLRKLDRAECPSPSRVALELMSLLEQPNAGINDAAQLVRLDSVLTAKVLELANSALYRGLRPVLVLPDALLRLGLRTLAHFVLSLSLIKAPCPIPRLDLSRYWAQALLRGLFVEELVAHTGSWARAEVFTLGLLNDFGYLAEFCVFPERMAEIVDAAPDAAALLAAEREQLGLDHVELTAALLERWGFPELMLRAVRSERDPAPIGEEPRLQILCYVLEAGRIFADHWDGIATEVQIDRLRFLRQQLQISDVQYQEILQRLQTEWLQWSQLFAAQVPADLGQRWSGFVERMMHASGEQSAYRVLVVDDDEASRHLLRRYLEPVGYEVYDAADVSTAMQVIDTQGPRIVLIDWYLGQDDGLEFCQRLRSRYGARMYLVLLSAFADEGDGTRALECGANEFLSKPVSRRVLLAKLRSAVDSVALLLDLEDARQKQLRAQEQLLHLTEELRDEALRDALTGLYNRRAWETLAPGIWQRATSAATPISCIILDIDYFKQVNDQYGHDVGDRVLMALAKLLLQSTRETDLLVRLGGEEFVILIETADLPGVGQMMQRLASEIAQLQGDFPSITVSMGAASSHASTSLDELLHAADQNLLQAKRQGRNRIVCSDDLASALAREES